MIDHEIENKSVTGNSPIADGNPAECSKIEDSQLTSRRNCSWWKRRTNLERCLAAITLILAVICTTLVVINIVTETRLRFVQHNSSSICRSEECVKAAAQILDKIDSSANPCEDFFQFACGNFIKHNTVPDDHHQRTTIQSMQDDIYIALKKLIEESSSSNDSEAIRKLRKFYTSCMNTSSVEDGSVVVLLELLSSWGIGEWPILDPKWDKTEIDLEWRMAMLYVHAVQPFFHTFVAPDDKNSSVYLLHVYTGGPVLNAQYYLNNTEPTYIRYMQSYRRLMYETVRRLGATEKMMNADLEAILDFEIAFANLSNEDIFNTTSNETNPLEDEFVFNKVNISILEDTIPEIKWSVLLGYVFDYIGTSLEEHDVTIVMHCEKYLRGLVALLNETSPRTVANYLAWRFVAKYLPYLDIHFRRLYYDFRREVPNTSQERTYFARWKECIQLVNEGFGMAATSLYVKQEFNEQLENEIRSLVSSVKGAFPAVIAPLAWLDPETKTLCEEKVASMSVKVGYPRYILDPKQLDGDYSGLEITEDHFLKNILKMNRYEVTKELAKVTRAVDKERDWQIQPLLVNAFHEPTGNSIIFPAGILRTPIFRPNRPNYLNYGMFGVVVGHEIGHGFDTSGRKFDKVGNLTQWWSDEMIDKYKELAACYVEQYSQFPMEMVGQNVNGNHTIDDNICDNTGLQMAHMAYTQYVEKNGDEQPLPGVQYTNEQIFFLQYAQIWCEVVSKEGYEKYTKDDHSPGKYRANAPLMNFPKFSKAFQCPVNSPMNPQKKCRLWG